MTLDHLVLVGGGHTNVLLMQKWIMQPKHIPDVPITIISRDPSLVYSSMYPSVISNTIPLKQSLIDISSLAKRARISLIVSEVIDIDFNKKEVFLENRPAVKYSKVVLNCGTSSKLDDVFQDLINKKIALPIRPFLQSYKFIKSEDRNDSIRELPFVIIGSGLGAIEIAFALRKRWKNRKLVLVCKKEKISYEFLKSLKLLNIEIMRDINFPYSKILLCTGNSPHNWIKKNILKLDCSGRIITDNNLKVKDYLDIYAVGDCAYAGKNRGKSSGILAVKSAHTLYKNINRDIRGKKLKKWFPQKLGLQIVNLFNNKNPQKAFMVYGKFVFGPSPLFWYLKSQLDNNFLKKFKRSLMKPNIDKFMMDDFDCRGCAAKIPQKILNDSLKQSKLSRFADIPEDASEIFRNDKEIILQSVDGFPSLVSDPWLNAKIATLHACSDLWACGARIKSGQVLISIPKTDNQFQKYIFSQCLSGVKCVFDELGGEIVGGHTFESRSFAKKPYTEDVDLALTVQGVVKVTQKPWKKYGIKAGDILLMSRPLGIGIFFAAQMQNLDISESYEEIFKSILNSQQRLVQNIKSIQEKLGLEIINAATDITGYGFLGHLNEMVEASNLRRKQANLEPLRITIDLNLIRAYPGILDLIKSGIRSSLFKENKKILDQILTKNFRNQSISLVYEKIDSNNLDLKARRELLCDPQTCGPLLISCDPNYIDLLGDNWFKVGEVKKK